MAIYTFLPCLASLASERQPSSCSNQIDRKHGRRHSVFRRLRNWFNQRKNNTQPHLPINRHTPNGIATAEPPKRVPQTCLIGVDFATTKKLRNSWYVDQACQTDLPPPTYHSLHGQPYSLDPTVDDCANPSGIQYQPSYKQDSYQQTAAIP